MIETTNNRNTFTEEEQQLLATYYQNRKKKTLIVAIVLIVILIGIGGFFFINSKKETKLLELTTTDTVVIKQSKIDKFDAKKYIKYAKKSNTVIKIPDIKDTKNKAGKYKFQYSIYDKKTKGTQKEYLNIEIKDDIKPVLKLSDKEVNVTQNQEIDLLSYVLECTDNNDGDLKNKIKYNTITTENVGDFKVTYTVKDKAKNKTSKSITIKVSAPEPVENNDQSQEQNTENNSSEQNNQNNQNNQTVSQNNTQSNNQSSTSNSNNKVEKPASQPANNSHAELNGKQFLFTDGYDMSNVMTVCASELSRNHASGSCVPIYDNGVIIGAKIVIN